MPRVAHGARPRAFGESRAVRLGRALPVIVRAVVAPSDKEKEHWLEQLLAVLYIAAGVMFVVGSVCFLPAYSAYYGVGVWLYLVGGLIYLKTAVFDLEEAHNSAVLEEFEVAMNRMYVVGSVCYLAATVLYEPRVVKRLGERKSQLYGSSGFILGSVFFVFACFLNGAHTGDAFNTRHRSHKVTLAKILVLATTNATMSGALLFLLGSVLYLPVLGCSETTVDVGTCFYLVGSVFFTIAGVLPVLRRRFANVENLDDDDPQQRSFLRPPSSSKEDTDERAPPPPYPGNTATDDGTRIYELSATITPDDHGRGVSSSSTTHSSPAYGSFAAA